MPPVSVTTHALNGVAPVADIVPTATPTVSVPRTSDAAPNSVPSRRTLPACAPLCIVYPSRGSLTERRRPTWSPHGQTLVCSDTSAHGAGAPGRGVGLLCVRNLASGHRARHVGHGQADREGAGGDHGGDLEGPLVATHQRDCRRRVGERRRAVECRGAQGGQRQGPADLARRVEQSRGEARVGTLHPG